MQAEMMRWASNSEQVKKGYYYCYCWYYVPGYTGIAFANYHILPWPWCTKKGYKKLIFLYIFFTFYYFIYL